jgi:hypothetical protein
MGDRMTMQSKILAGDGLAGDILADRGEPPHAPLHMPKQVLTAEPGALRRKVYDLLVALMPGRRRPG